MQTVSVSILKVQPVPSEIYPLYTYYRDIHDIAIIKSRSRLSREKDVRGVRRDIDSLSMAVNLRFQRVI
jgi:hypothetical protein